MCEPTDGWGCKFDASPEPELTGINPDTKEQISQAAGCSGVFGEGDKDFSFPCGPSLSEDDDELTESKIRAFLDEKVLISVKISCIYICYRALNNCVVEMKINMSGF